MKSTIYIFMLVGSVLGGYIPALWGSGMFSFSSIIFSAVGAIIGIYIGFRISQE